MIKPLVGLLDPTASVESQVHAHAACALMEVCQNNPSNCQRTVEAGGVAQLASLLIDMQQGEAVKAEVAGALWALSEDEQIKVPTHIHIHIHIHIYIHIHIHIHIHS